MPIVSQSSAGAGSLIMSKRGGETATPTLPAEVVMEILTWLPLKPLARAQLVRKEWREMIQDHQFMEKHIKRTSYVDHWFNVVSTDSAADSRPRYLYLHGCDGLLLVKKHASHLHLLWNPASRLLLELPPPSNGSYGFAICFVPATRSYRIVSFFKDKASAKYGCQLLTPGGAASMEWRLIEFPELVNGNASAKKFVVPAGGDAHFVMLTELGKEAVAVVVSLDVENELLIVSHLPGDVFGGVGEAKAIDCDGKLGLAVIDKGKQELQVMVLEDFKKKRWCRNKEVIPLPFLKDEGFVGRNVVVLLIKEGGIWFWLEGEKIFVYTIETRRTSDVGKCKQLSLEETLYTYKPSLVTFEDMKADDEVERYRPCNLELD